MRELSLTEILQSIGNNAQGIKIESILGVWIILLDLQETDLFNQSMKLLISILAWSDE